MVYFKRQSRTARKFKRAQKLTKTDHVTRMSHKRTAKQLMDPLTSGKTPRMRSRTRWRNYVQGLALSRLGIPPTELPLVAGDRDAWKSQLELLPP